MSDKKRSKVTISDLFEKKAAKQKIVRMAVYDYPTARLADEAGLDMILVGDSFGMNVLGFEDTLSVTMDMMLLFAGAVRRGAPHCFLVVDMPYQSYSTPEMAVRNARMLADVGADAVKLEGGGEVSEIVSAITAAEILVNGHIGLTPQSYKQLGGYKVQGRNPEHAIKLIRDAKKLEKAGAVLLLLEAIPPLLGEKITENVSIPTLSIGAGPNSDGVTMTFHDFAGFSQIKPKFAKQYCNLNEILLEAMKKYVVEIRSGVYPAAEHCYSWEPTQQEEFLKLYENEYKNK